MKIFFRTKSQEFYCQFSCGSCKSLGSYSRNVSIMNKLILPRLLQLIVYCLIIDRLGGKSVNWTPFNDLFMEEFGSYVSRTNKSSFPSKKIFFSFLLSLYLIPSVTSKTMAYFMLGCI